MTSEFKSFLLMSDNKLVSFLLSGTDWPYIWLLKTCQDKYFVWMFGAIYIVGTQKKTNFRPPLPIRMHKYVKFFSKYMKRTLLCDPPPPKRAFVLCKWPLIESLKKSQYIRTVFFLADANGTRVQIAEQHSRCYLYLKFKNRT